MSEMINMSKIIKSLRTKKGWTQNELAKRSGCTVIHINRIESETRYPSGELLDTLLSVLLETNESDKFMKLYNNKDFHELLVELSDLDEPQLSYFLSSLRLYKKSIKK
jgi:transcriptional regulator with XRE-family HTH domain